jgi:hypothetical protein
MVSPEQFSGDAVEPNNRYTVHEAHPALSG